MAQLKKNRNVSASTLQETVIAFTIIVFVFGIALLVLNNLMRTENKQTEFRANTVVEKYFSSVNDTVSQIIERKDFRLERNFYPYPGDSNLVILEVKVTDDKNKLITRQKEILLIKSIGQKK